MKTTLKKAEKSVLLEGRDGNIWLWLRKAEGLPLEWIPKLTQDEDFNRWAEKMKPGNTANAFLSLGLLLLFTTSTLGSIQGDYIMTE